MYHAPARVLLLNLSFQHQTEYLISFRIKFSSALGNKANPRPPPLWNFSRSKLKAIAVRMKTLVPLVQNLWWRFLEELPPSSIRGLCFIECCIGMEWNEYHVKKEVLSITTAFGGGERTDERWERGGRKKGDRPWNVESEKCIDLVLKRSLFFIKTLSTLYSYSQIVHAWYECEKNRLFFVNVLRYIPCFVDI